MDRIYTTGPVSDVSGLLFSADRLVGESQSFLDKLHASAAGRFAGKESESEIAA